MAPPPNPPTIITLRIKVPPGSVAGNGHDVFDLGEVPTAATVGRLRQNIERALPSHPTPTNQRLLYAGRALVDNEQTIAEALNTRRDPSQTEYVVHLLVKGEGVHASHTATASTAVNVPPTVTPDAATLTQQPGIAPANAHVHHNHHHHHQNQHLAHAQAHAQALAQHHARQTAQQQALFEASRQNPGINIPQRLQQMPQIRPRNPLFPPQTPGFPTSQNLPGMMNRPGPPHGQTGGTNPLPATSNASVPSGMAELDPTQPTTQAATQTSAAQPSSPGLPQAHQNAPLRPVSGQGFHLQGIGLNGQHFQVHQQTLNFPGHIDPQRLLGLMGRPAAPAPAMPSALDRARENMVEIQRMLDDMRRNRGATEEGRALIDTLQERATELHRYIDPLGLGVTPPGRNGRSSAPPGGQNPASPDSNPSSNIPTPITNNTINNDTLLSRLPPIGLAIPSRLSPQPAQPADVTCYLLSSPQGPHALLFSPEHGTYQGRFQNRPLHSYPTPTTSQAQQPPTPAANNAQQELQLAPLDDAANAVVNPPPDAVAAAVAQQAQARAAENANPLQALLGHFWLLLRLLIFAYFLLGSNMGWRRPLALALIGLGFWMVRMGLFGDGGVARRWWDGIVAIRPVPGAQRNEPAAENGNQARQAGAAFPTPEQVAQRLLDAQNEQNRDRIQRLRELVRPVERVMALFIASLWPGVGEERVRLQEAEERRVREEEVERNRLAVEAREAETKRKAEEEAGIEEAAKGDTIGEGSASVAATQVDEGDVATGVGESKKDR